MSSPSSSPSGAADQKVPGGRSSAGGVRTAPRSKARRKAAPLAKIGMVIFAIGLLAIFTDMVMFAAGSRNLPLWVNLTAMLAPLGLGLGLIGVVVENRHSSRALAARKAGTDGTQQ